MEAKNVACYKCKNSLDHTKDMQISRRDTCSSCGADVRACKNCKFYDTKAYNDCTEPSAERVVDKEKANFCDYFSLGAVQAGGGSSEKDEAMKKLDELFKR